MKTGNKFSECLNLFHIRGIGKRKFFNHFHFVLQVGKYLINCKRDKNCAENDQFKNNNNSKVN
jgi:hypothetical protein